MLIIGTSGILSHAEVSTRKKQMSRRVEKCHTLGAKTLGVCILERSGSHTNAAGVGYRRHDRARGKSKVRGKDEGERERKKESECHSAYKGTCSEMVSDICTPHKASLKFATVSSCVLHLAFIRLLLAHHCWKNLLFLLVLLLT